MKVLKTILVSLALLLICNTGVLADTVTQPTAYINAQGIPTTQTLTTITQDPPAPAEVAADSITSATLTATSTGSWYWGGATEGTLTVNKLSLSGAAQSGASNNIVNIVVGPNGQDNANAAFEVKGGLEIPEGVTLNIFQAADGMGTTPPRTNQCKMVVTGAQVSGAATGAGVTVNGELNVYSGSLYGVGGAAAAEHPEPPVTTSTLGLDINGTAKVGLYGTLRGNSIPAGTNNTTNVGIDINGGTLTSDGTIVSCSGNIPTSPNAIIGGSISGLSNLTVNNGEVLTSVSYDDASDAHLNGGIWSYTPASSISENTAFGTSTFVITGNYFGGNDANLTVLSDANLTLANGSPNYTWKFSTSGGNNGNLTIQPGGVLNVGVTPSSNIQNVSTYYTSAPFGPANLIFGTGSGTAPKGQNTLNIGSGSILNIAGNANVTMNVDSSLTNNGTINVLETSSTTPAT